MKYRIMKALRVAIKACMCRAARGSHLITILGNSNTVHCFHVHPIYAPLGHLCKLGFSNTSYVGHLTEHMDAAGHHTKGITTAHMDAAGHHT